MKNQAVLKFFLSCAAIVSTASSAQTLKEAIQETLVSSPEVRITTNHRRSTDEALKQARGGYFPRVDLILGNGRETSNNSNTRALGSSHQSLARREASLTLSQMLFDGFATSSEVERNGARVDSAAFGVAGAAEDMGLRTVEVYLEVLRQQELLALAQENLATHQKTFDQIQLRAEGGTSRKADEDQASARLALARANVLAEEANLRDANTSFLRVVGQMPKALARPTTMTNQGLPKGPEDAVREALANHPTLRSATADTAAAEAQRRAARAAMMPRFDLEMGVSDNNNMDGVRGKNSDSSIMVRMRYNLFRGTADQAREAETAHLAQEAREVMHRTRRQVEENMRLSWSAMMAAADRMEPLKVRVDAIELARGAYAKQFSIGQRTLLDLLDAENELFSARQAYVNGQYTQLFAHYRVLNGMGQLLLSVGIAAPEEARLASAK